MTGGDAAGAPVWVAVWFLRQPATAKAAHAIIIAQKFRGNIVLPSQVCGPPKLSN